MMKERRNILLTLGLLIALSLISSATLGFSLEIPEEVENRPEEEKAEWVEEQMKEARQEQIKVGKERFEKRIETKKELQRHLKKQALENRRIIRQSRFAYAEDERKSKTTIGAAVLLCAAAVIPLLAVLVYRRKTGETVEIPKITSKFRSKSESRMERDEALKELGNYLKKSKNDKKN